MATTPHSSRSTYTQTYAPYFTPASCFPQTYVRYFTPASCFPQTYARYFMPASCFPQPSNFPFTSQATYHQAQCVSAGKSQISLPSPHFLATSKLPQRTDDAERKCTEQHQLFLGHRDDNTDSEKLTRAHKHRETPIVQPRISLCNPRSRFLCNKIYFATRAGPKPFPWTTKVPRQSHELSGKTGSHVSAHRIASPRTKAGSSSRTCSEH